MVEEDIKNIWNEQALRGLILVSLALQIILSPLGNLRKYNPRTLIRATLWVVYFLAYAVIPAALGITAQTALEAYSTSRSILKHHKSSTSELMSFWAPFLLLHLGGPDSINGYSLQDNEFWLRHLMFVVFQSGVALYILLSSWTGRGSHLPLLSICVYAAGCIKCFQRVQAQRLGNIEHLRESMLDPAEDLQESMLGPTELQESLPAPGEHLQEPMLDPDHLSVIDRESMLDPAEDLQESMLGPDELQESMFAPDEHLQELMLVPAEQLQMLTPVRETMLGMGNYLMEEFQLEESQDFIVEIDQENAEPPRRIVHASPENRSREILEAYNQFQTFKRLLVDLVVTNADRDRSRSYFRHLDSALEAFHVVETELGFAYDRLYTEASVAYICEGLILHAARVFLLLLVLMGFHFYIDMDDYQAIDIDITYILLIIEIVIEIIAVFIMLRSPWIDLWLKKHMFTRDVLIFPFLKKPSEQRVSYFMAQTDLLSVALMEKPAIFLPLQKFLGVDEYLEKLRYETYVQVSDNLKDMIYEQLHDSLYRSDRDELCIPNGSFTLRENECETLLWSINEGKFDQSILIWHIATTLCYYTEVNVDDQYEINRIESKHISEYLMNLLISYPEMLPMGIGVIRYRETCADAMRFFKTKGPTTKKAEACRKLLEVGCKELLHSTGKGDRSKSVLFDGCRLALSLIKMKRERMWKVMSQVWIEMLAFAAANCEGVRHLRQLGERDEFLSHVWLLMAHLGMTEHFQQQKGSYHAISRYDVTHNTKGGPFFTPEATQFWEV